ncbi:MAG: choice-of-anchor D domain-containing protein [Urechidicola sp.]|nr:choice-of-anchor D domain-containing protein [Urechidicola sp.]
MRFNTSIWEYIGAASGDNEFIVRGRYAVALNGATNSTTQVLSGISNANNCIPFITGILNNASSNDADSGTAIAYLEDSTTLRVQKGTTNRNVTVYITVVEFTGTNWTILHGDSGDIGSDSGTLTLRDGSDGTGTATDVSDWTEAVIFSHFRADNDSSDNEAIADLWPVTDPGSNDQTVDWTFHNNHDSNGLNRHFVHVLNNTGLNITRYQDASRTAGESTIDITSAGLTDMNQALIIGSSTSSGNGNAYARGWRNYYLNSATEAAHWAHRSNNTLSHEIQIVDLASLTTTSPNAEINILGNGVTIPDGNTVISMTDDTDFGELETTGAISVAHTFTIENVGSLDLTLDNPSPYVVLTGATADFTLTANPSTPITAGNSTTFTITYDPTTSGTHTATISIANNDSDEDPYTFLIQGKGEYCASNGSLDYDTSVTYVSFNTISNADNEIPKDNAYEDFTNLSTNVYRNLIHNLTVNVNTDGLFTVYTNVWIDWNNDGDFDDAGEEYDMGSAYNVTDGSTSNSPLAVTIPITAIIGSTTMRVATKWASYPSSCDAGFDGEVEDYSVNIIDYLIDFNGVDEHIDFEDNHDLTSSFSLEAWVLQETTVTDGTIISKGNIDLSLKTGYHLTLTNNYPNLTWYDNANSVELSITSPYTIPNNEWHHIAATYNGTTAYLYIDGIEVISGTPTSAPLNTPQDFIIGAKTANYATTPLNIDFFDGAIQDARIWDIALSETQIREMMNQHIAQNGTAVIGTVVPLTISGGLLWSNLLGYYPLDSNTAFDNSSNGIDGTPHDITSSQVVSAPLPYETVGDTSWDTSSTWLNSTDIYIPNTTGVDGSTSIDWNIVELTNDITSGNRNITLLGLISSTEKLTIDGTSNIATGTGTGYSLTISNYLELDGEIDLVGESQLIQPEGSILDADSGGSIEKDQQGTANSFNYNYWSSSVAPASGSTSTIGTGIANTNNNFTISGVLMDGTDPDNPNLNGAIQFLTAFDAADSNTPPDPRILSSYWFYKFYGVHDDYSAWVSIDENTSLLPGEGYTMKGTSGAANIDTGFQNYVFKGLPNNGDITLQLDNSSNEVARLVGNPYASALDATEFILDNMGIADGGNNATGNIFNGAIYFWDHFGEENSHYSSGYIGGYATRNLLTGTVAISIDTGDSGTKIPGPYIPVNQGFFVVTELDGFENGNGDVITTVAGGDIIFKNSQRTFQEESTGNSIFMRSSDTSTENNQTTDNNTFPIIRLIYESPNGFNRQIAIGVNENTGNHFDFGYDAPMIDINNEDMYWLLNNTEFVIQSVQNFNPDQEFSLGLIVSEAGSLKIKIDALEYIDESVNLFIKDNETNIFHDLRASNFEIQLPVGVYNTRFSLVFHNQVLSEDDELLLTKDILIYMDNPKSEIHIKNNGIASINNITLHNIIGQQIKIWNIEQKSSNIQLPIDLKTGVYIVTLDTDLGTLSKKIIIE